MRRSSPARFAEGADAQGPALDSARGKGKNKGKQAGRGAGSRKQQTSRGAGRGKAALSKAKARVSSRSSAPSLAGASSLPPDDGSSARGSASTGGNEEEGPAHWINDLSISNMLSGRFEKLNYHYANKAFGGLQKAENSSRSSNVAAPTQLLLLKSHLELYRAAEKLLPGSIKKLARETRRETLRQLHVHGHEIPPFTRGSVLLQVCLETDSVEEQVGMLVPVAEGDPESWDSDQPSMATTGLSTLEQGKLIQRLLFEETLLRFLMESDDGKVKCKLWAKAVLNKMKPVAEQDNVDFSPVLKQAVDDPPWTDLLQEFMRTHAGHSLHMTEVERCVESLKASDVRLASLTDVFAKLPTWCESLRRGTVQDVVDVVSTACSVFLNNKETTIAEFENMGEDEIQVVTQDLLSFSTLLAKGSKLPHFSEAGSLNRRTSEIVQMAKQGQKVAILQKALEEFVDDDGGGNYACRRDLACHWPRKGS